jgi:tetratricopeptide (TPR) repeat protein
VVSALLNKKADIKSRAPPGATVLHLAASNGDKEIVMTLLERGADPRERDNTGWTAAHRAAAEGHKDVVMMLLDADNDIEDRIGILSMLISLCPDDYIFPKLLGDTLCKEGNPQEAVAAYDLAIQLYPRNKSVKKVEEIEHGDVFCVGCKKKIKGIWYHCPAGDGFEVCQGCHDTPLGESHTFLTGHRLLAIPSEEYLHLVGLSETSKEEVNQ